MNGPFSASFVYFGEPAYDPIPLAKLPAVLDEHALLGMDMVTLASAKATKCGAVGFKWLPGFPAKIGAIAREASLRGIGVYVGLVQSVDACGTAGQGVAIAANRASVATMTAEVIQALEAAVAPADRAAILGYYLPDEANLSGYSIYKPYFDQETELHRVLVQTVRTFAPGKKVLAAPFFKSRYKHPSTGATTWMSPAQLGAGAAQLAATGVDIIAVQDSLGNLAPPGSADDATPNLVWNRYGVNDQPPYSLAEYVRGMHARIGSRLYIDLEPFAGGPLAFGASEAAYSPASIQRIMHQRQQALAGGAAGVMLFNLQYFASETLDPAYRRKESPRLAAELRAAYRLETNDQLLRPTRYVWQTAVSPSYPDSVSAPKLFDGLPGDPKSFVDPTWVGTLGPATAEIQLDRERTVKWVSAHVLNFPPAGIAFPDSLTVTCTSSSGAARTFGPYPLAVARSAIGDYVMGAALPAPSCLSLTVKMQAAPVWTFVSEISIVGS